MGIIPYIGGKRLLSKEIVSMMPEHTCYVEAFAGGASVLFRKPPSKMEVINDINNELVTLYRVVQNHKEEFLRQFQCGLASRWEYERLKMIPQGTLTDIQKAVRFYYLQKQAFGGKVAERSYGCSTTHPKINFKTIEKSIASAHERIKNINIENLPYAELIKRYDREYTLFYLDPPYHKVEDYYGKGIFAERDYTVLRSLCESMKGKFIMSINDTDYIRQVFSKFNIKDVTVNYSLNRNQAIKASELLITNFQI